MKNETMKQILHKEKYTFRWCFEQFFHTLIVVQINDQIQILNTMSISISYFLG